MRKKGVHKDTPSRTGQRRKAKCSTPAPTIPINTITTTIMLLGHWIEMKSVIGTGSDVAVENADVILVRSNPSDVVGIVRLSRATYRKMMQKLVWATGYNVVPIPLAAGAAPATEERPNWRNKGKKKFG